MGIDSQSGDQPSKAKKPLNERQKAFIDRVAKLKLRFPVAEIAKRTKAAKSNISAILNGTKEPSDNFLVKFSMAFEAEEKALRQKLPPTVQDDSYFNKYVKLLEERHAEREQIEATVGRAVRESLTGILTGYVDVETFEGARRELRALREWTLEALSISTGVPLKTFQDELGTKLAYLEEQYKGGNVGAGDMQSR